MDGLFLTGIGHLTTNGGEPIADAVVATDEGNVTYAGPAHDAPDQGSREHHDLGGRAVLPGFVDAHTHLVFSGDRSHEFARRLAGESYARIAAEGGGILSTVHATRAASETELFEEASARAWRMIRSGTTSLEIKSGYGLTLESELRLLGVARRIGAELPVTVKTTFLGAHSVPPEYAGDPDGYVDHLITDMLPAVSGLADYCDVFVEEGIFGVEQARRVFEAAREHGLEPRIHAEQLTHHGGARLAADIGAASADHLDHATEDDARAMAAAGVAAVLVPGASYSLRSHQAPGPMLWEAGCTVALATDCNPGTSFLESMGLVISLAVVQMGLTADQAIWAATRGGALSLGLNTRGHIAAGSPADLVVLDAPTPDHIPYRPATALTWGTIQDGHWVHKVE
ncbi:MAG: imidazolonepropionase [Actinomycetota bacterium]|nr:imidazolonepropionase [Actinomycetota bacterium]